MTDHELEPITRKDGSQGLPARGYKWPDATEGNFIALKHGADSPRVVDTAAKVLTAAVITECPWLQSPVYEDALWRYARSEARAQLLSSYIMRVGEEHPEKIPVRLWGSASSADRAADKLAQSLGITPLSRAALANIVTSTERTAAGLDELQATGAAIRQRRQSALAEADDDDR